MYCGTHDMMYCTKCIATEHRSCIGVVVIEDVNPSATQQDEIQRLQDKTKEIQEQLASAEKRKHKNLELLEDRRSNALETIEETERNLVAHIRKIKEHTTRALERHYTNVREEFKSDVSKIENATKEVEQSRTQLKAVVHMDSQQQFVHMKLIKSSVFVGKKTLEDDKSEETKGLSFIENTDLMTYITEASSLGQIEIGVERTTAPRRYKVKSKRKINVKMRGDSKTCHICDICQLPDGTVLLTDCDNRNLKCLESNYNIRNHCDLDARPMGVCYIGQNEVAVKLDNNTVQFIFVSNSLNKSRQISIEGGDFMGIAFRDGTLWVSNGSGVNVYSTSGTLLKSIMEDADGQNIFNNGKPHQMSVSGEGVIITDNRDGAVYVGRNGLERQEIRDGKLVYVEGVTVSNDGTVFLSGYNIMMFRPDGTCLGELVSKDDDLVNPFALGFDNQRNCLIVSCGNSDNVNLLMLD